jgi:NAD(P)-dependent dehydrogenase (short-subunit alcohol dehydrogenase family)
MQKIVVITGASSGIGEQTAILFKNAGHIVVNLSNNVTQQDKFNLLCDVSNQEQVKQCFEQIEKDFGKIDILINNAGYGISGATEIISLEQAKHQFDVNFFGGFLCNKYALPLMQKGSRIVFISSACAIFPLPYRTLYCASKAAVSMMSKSIRMELKQAGIDVVAICPGDTRTNFTANRIKNFQTNQRYGSSVQSATQKLDGREHKRMSKQYVAKKIFAIANKRTTKPEYIIGPKYKVFYAFSRLVPQKLFLNILHKMFSK